METSALRSDGNAILKSRYGVNSINIKLQGDIMKRMTSFAFLMVLVLSMAGCTSGRVIYSRPWAADRAETSVTVPQTKDIIWQKLLSGIGDSFFIINNVDKESGFINVSYSGDPCRFVDCGTIDSDIVSGSDKRNYNFPACKVYQEYEIIEKGQNMFLKRSMSLDGRANIVVQEGENGTHVKVNVRYVVQKKVQVINDNGRLAGTDDDSISFNSNGIETFPQHTNCLANGKFEKALLDIVRD